jgi:hypothetical protein
MLPQFIFAHPPPFKEEEGLAPLLNNPLSNLYKRGFKGAKPLFINIPPLQTKLPLNKHNIAVWRGGLRE